MVKSRYKNGCTSLWWSTIDIQYKKDVDLGLFQVPLSSQNLDVDTHSAPPPPPIGEAAPTGGASPAGEAKPAEEAAVDSAAPT